MADLTDLVWLPLDRAQIDALAAGERVRIDIPADPELGTDRVTVVILRQQVSGERRHPHVGTTRHSGAYLDALAQMPVGRRHPDG